MDRQYVGIDFHRRRSVIVRENAAGERLGSVRVANDPLAIAAAVAEAGPVPEVVIEATSRRSRPSSACRAHFSHGGSRSSSANRRSVS